MSALLKWIIVLIIWFLYSWLVFKSCSDNLCLDCNGSNTTGMAADSGAVIAKRYPIDFRWNEATAYTNEGFEARKNELTAQLTKDNVLEISGFYYEGETAPQGYENMGLARAAKIRDLLVPGIPAERIELRARLIDGAPADSTAYFEGAAFRWIQPEAKAGETVEELDDRILIRFPFNSTEKDYDPQVDEYIVKLAKRLQQTGESVSLAGHTDNVGEADANLQLGQSRADAIKSLLIKNGVNAALVQATSKGETQPVASNDSEEGRHNNRRVEVRLLKKQ